MTRPNPSAAKDMAQGTVERMGPAALADPAAHLRLIDSFGILRGEAIAIVNAERVRRGG